MKNYLFLFNSTKPDKEQNDSLVDIKLNNFSLPCLYAAKALSYNIFVGINRKHAEKLNSNFSDARFYNACIYRDIFDFKSNYQAFRNLMNLLNHNQIDVIHCNTPIGGLLGRLCGTLKHVPKIIYTAHGFHFYKGNQWYKNIIFRTAERIMARYTDVIITINEEDFEAAKKFKLKKNGKVFLVPGVGINSDEYNPKNNKVNKQIIKENLGFKDDDILIVSAGDLVARKNYSTAIKAIAKTNISNIHYLVCGKGILENKLKRLSRNLGIANRVHFLGYREDIKNIMLASDIFLLTSYQEGLPRSTMEAMASGLPCIVSKIRGNVDLIKDNLGGYLVYPNDVDGYKEAIYLISADTDLRKTMGRRNLEKIKEFDTRIVQKEISNIYFSMLGGL